MTLAVKGFWFQQLTANHLGFNGSGADRDQGLVGVWGLRRPRAFWGKIGDPPFLQLKQSYNSNENPHIYTTKKLFIGEVRTGAQEFKQSSFICSPRAEAIVSAKMATLTTRETQGSGPEGFPL